MTARRAQFGLRTGQPLPARCNREWRGPLQGHCRRAERRGPRRSSVDCGCARNRRRRVQRDVSRRRLLSRRRRAARASRRARLCVSLQVQHDQLVVLAPMLERAGVRVLLDHCGRPNDGRGVSTSRASGRCCGSPRTGRVFVKLSGYVKFAQLPFPYDDARPFVDALLDAFTPAGCLWASDWPFLRAGAHRLCGPLLEALRAPRSATPGSRSACCGKRRARVRLRASCHSGSPR